MVTPPTLDHCAGAGPAEPYYALLINPFYPKDPNASFGKHVLTPTLGLDQFRGDDAGTLGVRYWDENLLDGRPAFCSRCPRWWGSRST